MFVNDLIKLLESIWVDFPYIYLMAANKKLRQNKISYGQVKPLYKSTLLVNEPNSLVQ